MILVCPQCNFSNSICEEALNEDGWIDLIDSIYKCILCNHLLFDGDYDVYKDPYGFLNELHTRFQNSLAIYAYMTRARTYLIEYHDSLQLSLDSPGRYSSAFYRSFFPKFYVNRLFLTKDYLRNPINLIARTLSN